MFNSVLNLFGPPSPITNEPTIDYNHTINTLESTRNGTRSARNSLSGLGIDDDNLDWDSDDEDFKFRKYGDTKYSDFEIPGRFERPPSGPLSRPISRVNSRFDDHAARIDLKYDSSKYDKYDKDNHYNQYGKTEGLKYNKYGTSTYDSKYHGSSRDKFIPEVNYKLFETKYNNDDKFSHDTVYKRPLNHEIPGKFNSLEDTEYKKYDTGYKTLDRDYKRNGTNHKKYNSGKIPDRYSSISNPISIYQDPITKELNKLNNDISLDHDLHLKNYKKIDFNLNFLNELNDQLENNNKFLKNLNDLIDCNNDYEHQRENEHDNDKRNNNEKFNELRKQYINELNNYQTFYNNYINVYKKYSNLKNQTNKVSDKIRLIKNTTNDNSIKLICNNILNDLRQ